MTQRLIITIFILFIAIMPLLATHDPIFAESGAELQGPSAEHWLGTDYLGRDVWSRLVIGGRRTLGAAVVATCIAVGGGLTFSALQQSRWFKLPAGILLDALLAFPALLIALVIRTLLTGSWLTLALAIGLAGVAPYARVASDAIQVAWNAPHIEGARAIGVGTMRIFLFHLVPTALPTLTSFGSIIFGWMILYQAALAFLGLGGSSTQPDWGVMLNNGRGYLEQAPLLVLCPGGMIALSVWLANTLADDWRSIRR
jgi:peptide/nickel transport system permease protein